MTISTDTNIESYLSQFGLARFRPGQKEVITSLVEGQDCICIMPTGGGKSLCYQLPSIMREGVTLVVSPLIALMKDQVDSMGALGIEATYINSSLTPEDQVDRLNGLQAGQYDLIYIAPERFRSSRFLEAIRGIQVQLLAIDEAHCISQWGHDFRPDYARLGRFRTAIGSPQTIALTATATPAVRDDVIAQLGLSAPQIFITGFARPNLKYSVQRCETRRDKDQVLRDFLQERAGPGIIYASSRDRCVEVANEVSRWTGQPVGVYHAGLEQEERSCVQEDFMSGKIDIVVATVAFGMGVDKANVRFVVHYNMPGSLEAYYQEAGRAGRDNLPAHCLLLFSAGDKHIHEFFIETAYPSRETVATVYEYLRCLDEDPIELTRQQIKDRLHLEIGTEGVGACEKMLEQCGALERLEPRQNMAAVLIDSELPTLVDFLPRQASSQRRVLQTVERIVGDRRCERVYLQLSSLAESLEMGVSAVSRTMRELSQLETFDYVPPFRGRAVHVLRCHRRFESLDIDFDRLDLLKEAEYEKLRKMTQFARWRQCRQLFILSYFGDQQGESCQACDNCDLMASPGGAKGLTLLDGLADPLYEIVVITLSGIARIEQKFFRQEINFGKQMVAQMLCGSKSVKIVKWHLEELSTFGLLSNFKQTHVIGLIDALIDAGLVEQNEIERFRPVIRLTGWGGQVMRGQDVLTQPLGVPHEMVEQARRRWHVRSPSSVDELADNTNDILPRPRDFPAELTNSTGTNGEMEEGSHSKGCVDSEPVLVELSQEDHYWTWRLLDAGFSLQECCLIRGISMDRLVDHAARSLDEGRFFKIEGVLSQEQIVHLDQVLLEKSSEHIQLALSDLPFGMTKEIVHLYLKCRRGVMNVQ